MPQHIGLMTDFGIGQLADFLRQALRWHDTTGSATIDRGLPTCKPVDFDKCPSVQCRNCPPVR